MNTLVFINRIQKNGVRKMNKTELVNAIAKNEGIEKKCAEKAVNAVFAAVADALAEKGFESLSGEVGMIPDMYTAVDADTASKIAKLINRLEDNDDVQNVYSNVEYPDGFDPDAE